MMQTRTPTTSPAAGREPAHVIENDAEAIAIARRLAADFLVGASERDRERRLPWAELDRFSQSGLWAMNVPKAYGGAAVSYATVARVFAIVASGDASIAQVAQNHISLLDVVRFDPDETRKRFCSTPRCRACASATPCRSAAARRSSTWRPA